MRLDEIFNKETQYQWTDNRENYAKGVFKAGDVTYTVQLFGGPTSPEGTEFDEDEDEMEPVIAPGYDRYWELMFAAQLPGEEKGRMDNTGTGNQYTVYSTVIAMAKDHMQKFGIGPLYMFGEDNGRQSLYSRMVRKLLPNWTTKISEIGELIAVPPAP